MNLNFAGYGLVEFTPENPNFFLKDSDFKDVTTREVDRISKMKPKLANALCNNDTSLDEDYLIASSPPGIMGGDSGGPLVRFDKKSKKPVIIGIAYGKNIAD